MKKLIAVLLIATLLFTLSACGETEDATDTTTTTEGLITTTTTEENADQGDDTVTTTTVADTTTTANNNANVTTTVKTTTATAKATTTTAKATTTTKAATTTTKTTPTEPRFPEYYDLSRMTTSSVTIESMFRKVYAYSEHVAGYSGDPEKEICSAIYSVDGSADQLQYMDIYGYNLTLDDMLGSSWGGVDFYSELIGTDLKVNFKSATAGASLPFKNRADILPCIKRDIAKVKAVLGDKGNPYAHLDYNSQVLGIDNITDTMIEKAASCNSNTLRIMATDLTVDGKTFNMTFSFSSRTDYDGKDCYSFSIGIHTIR